MPGRRDRHQGRRRRGPCEGDSVRDQRGGRAGRRRTSLPGPRAERMADRCRGLSTPAGRLARHAAGLRGKVLMRTLYWLTLTLIAGGIVYAFVLAGLSQ